MAKTMKLTPALLRRIVLEERSRMMREAAGDPIAAGAEHPEDVEAAETDAADLAGTLEQNIDYMKALKIHEQRLAAKLKRIQEAKLKIRRRIVQKLG
jgi:hypothetical protein